MKNVKKLITKTVLRVMVIVLFVPGALWLLTYACLNEIEKILIKWGKE